MMKGYGIESAVFPIAGLGTRILPATKAIPKEMLTVLDTPLIEYAVNEARSIGVKKFIFVVAPGKSVVHDHFSENRHLEEVLVAKGKDAELQRVKQATLRSDQIFFPTQEQPLGLGHAVSCAREHVGDAPFAVILPDDLILGGAPCIQQMADVFKREGSNILAVEEVLGSAISRYGSMKPGVQTDNYIEVLNLVEKPRPEEAPSNLAVIGRYILSPTIFRYLEKKNIGAGGEIQITDAMQEMLAVEKFHAVKFEGRRYDCGNKAGFVAANFAYALADDSVEKEVRSLVQHLIDN